MKVFTKEIKIALVAVVGLVVLFYGLQFLKGATLFSTDNTYYISFSNISGLTSSSPIMADGYKVGIVKSIDYDFKKSGNITAEVEINKDMKIPEGTTAEISSDLLGNVQVDLILGTESGKYIAPLGTINGRLNSGALGQVKEMVPQVEKMLPKLDSILCHVNALLGDPAIGAVVHNAEEATFDLTYTTKHLNSLIASIEKEVPGLVGKADGVLDKANTAMGNATTITDNLANVDLQPTLQELYVTLNNLKTFTEALNNNSGSLGLLMNDRSVYDNLNATMAHADSLLINIKEHPKRYVHFSVFGKKDK